MTHTIFFNGVLACTIMTILSVAVTSGSQKDRALPQAVEQSIHKEFPNAKIREVQSERRIVRLIEVTISKNGEEYDVTLTPKGTILFIKQEIDPDDLPPAVQKTVKDMSDKAHIDEAERVKVLAEFRAVPMKEPRIEYETEFRLQGKEHEATVTESGATLKAPKHLRYNKEDH